MEAEGAGTAGLIPPVSKHETDQWTTLSKIAALIMPAEFIFRFLDAFVFTGRFEAERKQMRSCSSCPSLS